jgi:LPS sulfotransferase NodH
MSSCSYLICATPRCGSTLLCELLKETGVAGRPEEYFEAKIKTGLPPHPGDYLGDLPPTGAGIRSNPAPPRAPEYSSLVGLSSYRDHLERTLRLGTTENGVFGAKLMWGHLPDMQTFARRLPEYESLELYELLEHLFDAPKYVWVTRGDKVRQAVSMWRALQTRSWRIDHGDDADQQLQLHYHFGGIDHLSAHSAPATNRGHPS